MFAPIVRVVGLEDKPKNEKIHREFTVPHYLPLRSSSFNKVVLELTDGMGNPMKFNKGNSVAVFHFRKKSVKQKKIKLRKFQETCYFLSSKLEKKDLLMIR